MVACRGIIVVLGAFMVHLTLGTIYCFGNMSPYMASYLKLRNSEEVAVADLTWVNAVTVASQGMFMCLGGWLDKRLGPMLTSLMGCLLMSAGVALTYFTIQSSMLMVILTYGFMFGAGISIAYISLLTCGIKWFPASEGIVNGIIVSGFGLGAFVFNQVQTGYLNPNNVPAFADGYFYDEDLLDKVPTCFLLLGGIYATMQLIGCLMVARPPPSVEEYSSQKNAFSTNINSFWRQKSNIEAAESLYETTPIITPNLSNQSLSPLQMVRTREFYLLYITFILNSQVVVFSSATYKAYGLTFIHDDYFLAMIGATAAIFNACGRISWGFLVDRSSYKVAMRLLCLSTCVILWTLPATPYGGKVMYGVWICALYLSVSGIFVLIPVSVFRTFGPEHSATNYGLVFSNAVFSGPLTAVLSENLIAVLDYVGMFYLLSVLSFIVFLLTFLYRERLKAGTRHF